MVKLRRSQEELSPATRRTTGASFTPGGDASVATSVSSGTFVEIFPRSADSGFREDWTYSGSITIPFRKTRRVGWTSLVAPGIAAAHTPVSPGSIHVVFASERPLPVVLKFHAVSYPFHVRFHVRCHLCFMPVSCSILLASPGFCLVFLCALPKKLRSRKDRRHHSGSRHVRQRRRHRRKRCFRRRWKQRQNLPGDRIGRKYMERLFKEEESSPSRLSLPRRVAGRSHFCSNLSPCTNLLSRCDRERWGVCIIQRGKSVGDWSTGFSGRPPPIKHRSALLAYPRPDSSSSHRFYLWSFSRRDVQQFRRNSFRFGQLRWYSVTPRGPKTCPLSKSTRNPLTSVRALLLRASRERYVKSSHHRQP